MGQELGMLLEIAKTQPQSAYSFFVIGFKE